MSKDWDHPEHLKAIFSEKYWRLYLFFIRSSTFQWLFVPTSDTEKWETCKSLEKIYLWNFSWCSSKGFYVKFPISRNFITVMSISSYFAELRGYVWPLLISSVIWVEKSSLQIHTFSRRTRSKVLISVIFVRRTNSFFSNWHKIFTGSRKLRTERFTTMTNCRYCITT